ncbi:MAG: hypothetical protein H7315_13230 [Herminiimonas sp.]|nr:hypothetical protein [Herminiimonas sp.]
MSSVPPSNAKIHAATGLFKAGAKRERSDLSIKSRRLELIESNRELRRDRDRKLGILPALSNAPLRGSERGSATLAVTSVIGALSFAIVAVAITLGSSITIPRLGIVIATPMAAALAGACIGAMCGAIIGRLLAKQPASSGSGELRAENRPVHFRSLTQYYLVSRTRFEQEGTTSNLG